MDAKTIGPRFVQLKSQDTDPTAMSSQSSDVLPEWRIAADIAYQRWETATATEHSHSRSSQSNDVLPERRIAADNTAYMYTDFVIWYRTHADQMWETAAATEHSESSRISTDALPTLGSLPDTTRRCITQADLVQTPRDATEHSPWEHAFSINATLYTMYAWYASWTVPTVQDSLEQVLVPMPASSAMSPQITGNLLQCVVCERHLCDTSDLAFFWRVNARTRKQGGAEVHLMLKPENNVHGPFIRSNVTQKGALASWQCECGFKLGDTRAVAVKKAAMTAFKSSSVMLCGHRFSGRKSQWPSIYNQPPFNTIEVRTRDTFSPSQM